jgi:hypothetical protein
MRRKLDADRVWWEVEKDDCATYRKGWEAKVLKLAVIRRNYRR